MDKYRKAATTITQNVRRLMNSAGMTEADLVAQTNENPEEISVFLSGEMSPTGRLLDRIAAVLGVSAESLFEDMAKG